MQSLRETIDTIEELVDDSYWPIPTYVDLIIWYLVYIKNRSMNDFLFLSFINDINN